MAYVSSLQAMYILAAELFRTEKCKFLILSRSFLVGG